MTVHEILVVMLTGAIANALPLMVPLIVTLERDPPWWHRMTLRARVMFSILVHVLWPLTGPAAVGWIVWHGLQNARGALREMWYAFFPRTGDDR